jgi:hypothetical protein
MKVNIYIGFWTLKMKCTQYGLYEQAAIKNSRASLFFEIGAEWGAIYSWDFLFFYFLWSWLEVLDRGPWIQSTSS